MPEVWAALFARGTKVEFEGNLWRIETYDEHGRARLVRTGVDPVSVDPALLIHSQTSAHRKELARKLKYTQTFATWETMADTVKDKARELAEHVREVRTGYKSGNREDALPTEPLEKYDSRLTATIGKRRAAKAAELHVSTRTLERWDRAYRDGGEVALTHQMRLRPRELFPRLDVRWFKSFEAVLRASKNKTLPPFSTLIEAATANAPDATPPSKSTAYRIKDVLLMGTDYKNISKTRASNNARPARRNKLRQVTFPGEVIQLDTTTLDVFCVDPDGGPPYRPELTVAIDQFTRCIVAMVIAKETNADHVAALIAEILEPKALDPSWPGSPKWPYCGMPFTVQYTAHEDTEFGPVMTPETIVVDNGKVFTGKRIKAIAALVGFSIEATRPGSGFSKGQVERFFGTLTRGALARLRGYTGGHVSDTLGNPQRDAHLTPDEVHKYLRQWVATQYHLAPQKNLFLPGTEFGGQSPFQMYAVGMESFGVLRAPVDVNLALQILPIKEKMISHGPIRMNNRLYNDPILTQFANRPSKVPGGKWLVHWSPADLTAVWLQDDDSVFHEIPWTESVKSAAPFDDAARAQVDEVRRRAKHLAGLRDLGSAAMISYNQFLQDNLCDEDRGTPLIETSQGGISAAKEFLAAASEMAVGVLDEQAAHRNPAESPASSLYGPAFRTEADA